MRKSVASYSTLYPPTVLASIFRSFDFPIRTFTAPARPLLTPAAAAERLAGAPSGAAPHRRVEGLVEFCD